MHAPPGMHMAMDGRESAYSLVSEPSPWWLRGLAIIMALLVIMMALGAVSGILAPMFVDRFVPDDWEEIEPYPEDGTEEDIANWTEGKEFWDVMVDYMDGMMGVVEFSALHSGLLAILGLFCIPVLWKGERELGIKLVGAWIGINLLGGIVMMWMISKVGFYPQFDFGPEAGGTEIPEAINTFSAIASGAQIVICNGILLAILVLVANKSKPETSFDIPSGFRPNEPPQS